MIHSSIREQASLEKIKGVRSWSVTKDKFDRIMKLLKEMEEVTGDDGKNKLEGKCINKQKRLMR